MEQGTAIRRGDIPRIATRDTREESGRCRWICEKCDFAETLDTAPSAPKRPKRRHIRDAVSYMSEDNGVFRIRTLVDLSETLHSGVLSEWGHREHCPQRHSPLNRLIRSKMGLFRDLRDGLDTRKPRETRRFCRGLRGFVLYMLGASGEGGIRTPVDPEAQLDFESSAFNRSATSPRFRVAEHDMWELW